ncbi:MAG: UPF0280 family protein [Alphaproteobacteria bacterium]
MQSGAMANWLDHRRLHLQHGPIDLLITAEGAPEALAKAYSAAADAFADVLQMLVAELGDLRRPAQRPMHRFEGPVSRAMAAAIDPYVASFHGEHYVTPMIAVAGSVADHVLSAMGGGLERAFVNNGGDIADDRNVVFSDVMLSQQAERGGKMPLEGRIRLAHGDGVGGIATSGRRGRSLSFGIADSVTVLASNAAAADVAATMIANAVTTESEAIKRAPANSIDDDSDLGERLVTVAVGALGQDEIVEALNHGRALALQLHKDDRIIAAYGRLGGHGFAVG